MKTEKLSLDTLSLWVCEKGPIREIVEIEFDVCLDRIVREEGVHVPVGTVQVLHDQVLPSVFIELLDGKQVIIKKGDEYFLSIEGQRDLQRIMEAHLLRHIGQSHTVSHTVAVSAYHRTFPPAVALAHRVYGLVRKLHSALFS